MHPEDERYLDYQHGQTFECEWINGRIQATIIKDDAVDPEFGTGVMTITPWHDHADFEIAERHQLDKEPIIDSRTTSSDCPRVFGMAIEEARSLIVEKLKTKGLLVEVDEKYTHSKSFNSRGGGAIEPQIREQWFIDVNKQAIDWKGAKSSLREILLMWFAPVTSGWFLIDLKVPTFTGLKIFVTGASADKSGGGTGFQLLP